MWVNNNLLSKKSKEILSSLVSKVLKNLNNIKIKKNGINKILNLINSCEKKDAKKWVKKIITISNDVTSKRTEEGFDDTK